MILGVIPARGGSKGIPRKNVRIIAGKPLVVWTIEAAKRSKLLDRIVVSTDDTEISKIAEKYNTEVVKRPPVLATDQTPMLSVLQHVLSIIDAEIVVLLQPTSPIRDDNLIDNSIKKFIESKVDSLATGFFYKFREFGACDVQRRQDNEGVFYDDGGVYVLKSELIKNGILFGKNLGRFETSKEQNIDIDEDFDLWLAEQVLLKRIAEHRQ